MFNINTKIRVWLTKITNANNEVKVRSNGFKSLATGAVTVGATAGVIKVGTNPLANRTRVAVYPPSAGNIYVGKTGVTALTGIPLASTATAPLVFDVDPNTAVALYAINDGTDRSVIVAEYAC